MKDILIGAAWPYANNSLHVGHLAALLPADVIARYHRGKGNRVIYVSGTDCHGTPITVRAKKEGVNPQVIATRYHEEFVKSFNSLDFSYDFYTATMNEEHKNRVMEYFKTIQDHGYIYEKEEEQDYCSQCGEYLSDREILGTCPICGGHAMGEQCDDCLSPLTPEQLKDKHCKVCGQKTVVKKNKHLYFKMSSMQSMLEELVKNREDKWRKNALSETKKYLKLGILDRATTRQLTWGVDVPVEGYEDKKIYVWIEAVLGYLTACEHVCKERNIDFEQFVTDKENMMSYFIHGKDNITFHTVIYPSLLEAINPAWQKPTKIISCEYVNMNDEKMSKSKGNLITFDELVNTYGKDTVRMYMISNGPEKKDVNFSGDDIVGFHNKFLVGVIGNFINRNLSFVNKKFDGIIHEGTIDPKIIEKTKEAYENIGSLLEEGELRSACEQVIEYATLGNKYYDEKQPWVQVKENVNQFYDTTYTCVYMMANLSNLLNPFIPSSADKMKEMLSLPSFEWKEITLKGDITIQNLALLFNRIED